MVNIQKRQILAGLVVMSLASAGWAQISSGLRSRSGSSSLNTIENLKTFYGNGVSNVAQYGSAYRFSQAPSNSLLQSSGSYSGSNSLGKPRGLSFGSTPGLAPTLRSSYGNNTQGRFMSGGAGNWNLSNQSSSNFNDMTSLSTMGGTESIILLPMTAQESAQQQWQVSAEQAIKPFDDKHLQKPASGTKRKSSDGEFQEPLFIPAQTASMNTFEDQSRLYTAQQLSMARSFTRQGQYDQALNSYQAARMVDSSNTSALVGTIFCHIMTGKLLAGGLNVLALSNQDPDFWQKSPDFSAAFGMSESQVQQAISNIELDIERYMDTYRAQDSKEVAQNIRLVHLSKMFLAWLKGDRSGMQTNIEAAAQATPLDVEVQRLCRGIAGCEEQKEIKLVPLKPLE